MKGFTLTEEVNRSTGKVLRGFHFAKRGYAPLSGLCPSEKVAIKVAEKALAKAEK